MDRHQAQQRPVRAARRDRGPGALVVEVLASAAGLGTSVRLCLAGAWLLVDCGDGAASALGRREPEAENLSGVVFTHGHPDHVGGLYAVLARLRGLGRRTALPLRSPKGCREPAWLAGAWRRRYPPSAGYPVRWSAFSPDRRFTLGPFSIRPFAVRHAGYLGDGRRGLLPAVGFEILAAGRRVVVSGDTAPCAPLDEAATGADLALVEATLARPRPDWPDSHLTVREARRVGRRARRYALYHLTPASRARVRPGEAVLSVSIPVHDDS